MAQVSLSAKDVNILAMIKDPESSTLPSVRIDTSRRPYAQLTDEEYAEAVASERRIILQIQDVEMQFVGMRPRTTNSTPVDAYISCLSSLDELISYHHYYLSARNNRVQAIRRLYGDNLLISDPAGQDRGLLATTTSQDRMNAASTVLADLQFCILHLTPRTIHEAISPQEAKMLSLVHTQRGAIYLATARALVAGSTLGLDDNVREERGWTGLDFEEAASREFALGGRYGNEIAKGLAVSTNPTAKLCGAMVREAMKKEYGPDFEV